VAAYLAVTGPATAAQRLLGLNPVAVAAATVALTDDIGAIAERAAEDAANGDLPDDGDALLDLLAGRHASRDLTLFSS
jgi:urease accessory protein